MKTILIRIAAAGLAAAIPAAASAAPIEGRWINAKGSIIVEVARCGPAYCGTVRAATDKARRGARKGGTANLVGTRVLTGLKPQGNGAYRGRAFDPKRNLHAPATVRQVEPNTMLVKGCAIGGMICKEQLWMRVPS